MQRMGLIQRSNLNIGLIVMIGPEVGDFAMSLLFRLIRPARRQVDSRGRERMGYRRPSDGKHDLQEPDRRVVERPRNHLRVPLDLRCNRRRFEFPAKKRTLMDAE